jgi:hypothetical protein
VSVPKGAHISFIAKGGLVVVRAGRAGPQLAVGFLVRAACYVIHCLFKCLSTWLKVYYSKVPDLAEDVLQ